jgi:hypothetical protein
MSFKRYLPGFVFSWALIIASGLVITSVVAAPTSPLPTASPTPLPVANGLNFRVTNVDEPDANGTFHCDYLTPTMRAELGIPLRIIYWCAR